MWAEPLEGWNCEAALLSRHAEYLLCGLTRKRYSTCLGFFTCTRTGVGRGGEEKVIRYKRTMLANVPEQVFYSAGMGDHWDSGGPIGWETPHSRFGSANHMMPQPAAEKILM